MQQLALAPDYKANRAASHADRPADWHARCDRLREALAHVLPTLYDPNDEADVEIARLIKNGGDTQTLIVSGDRDLLALLSDQVDVLKPGHASRLFRIGDFEPEYGFPPAGLALFRAITGDRSDNIKGLPYFPRKMASGLAARFRTAEAMYKELTPSSTTMLRGLSKTQREKLVNGEEQVRSNERLLDLLSIDGEPHLRQPTGDTQPLAELLREMGMVELADAVKWDPATGLSWTSFSLGLHHVANELQSPTSTELIHKPDKAVPSVRRLIGLSQEDASPNETAPPGLCIRKMPSGDSNSSDGSSPHRLVLPECWHNRLEIAQIRREQQSQPQRTVPRSPSYYANKLTFVDDVSGARSLVELAGQLRLTAVSFDWEFRHSRPGVFIKRAKGKEYYWYDPRSIVPLLLAVTLVEAMPDGNDRLISFVVDGRRPEVVAELAPLFTLPVKFLTH